MDKTFERLLGNYTKSLSPLLGHPFLRTALLQSTAMLGNLLSDLLRDQQRDPLTELQEFFECHTAYLSGLPGVQAALDFREAAAAVGPQDTDTIYGNAWTIYDRGTYEHSITLVTERLMASGITPEVIRGKRCFDGGCGIGRLSVALARMGAAEVVAVDHSQECLEYFRRFLQESGLQNIHVVQGDVTDLRAFADASFDFVATNGVLHHTAAPLDGLREHMRITRDSGLLWIYLYGAGGIYWPIFDALRPIVGSISVPEIKSRLLGMAVRPGFVYTFLDNMLAPRAYYTIDEIVAHLEQDYDLTWREADGPSLFDSPSRTAASPTASLLLGPGGEVRIIVTRLHRKAARG